MYSLRIGPDWASQISTIRDVNTEDTNLVRFDNTFYRMCRESPDTFTILVQPGTGRVKDSLQLRLRVRDFYVTWIGSQRFERYASTLDRPTPNVFGLDGAVQDLPMAQGTRLFELQSLIVFCIAESLRSDHIATAIEQMILATTAGLRGVSRQLHIGALLPVARAWGQTSDAIFRALSPQAQAIVLKPRSALSPEQRRFSERVELMRIDADLRGFANSVKVLKRPD